MNHSLDGAGGATTQTLARAKVNLCLQVTGRRVDGLHSLESLVVFPEFGDVLSVSPAPELEMTLDPSAPFSEKVEADESNLVLRAARRLEARTGEQLAVRLHLSKRVPVAAGLGGGSADAAAVLRLLEKRCPVAIDDEELLDIARELGADVPACLRSRAAWVRGAGEYIGPAADLPPFWIVLVYPGVQISTRTVFEAKVQEGRYGEGLGRMPEQFSSLGALVKWLRETRNDLWPVTRRLVSDCAHAQEVLIDRGSLAVGMSGSGSTQFGIFADREGAERAAGEAHGLRPGWWSIAAPVLGNRLR